MMIHVKNFCHINVHVESYEKPCDVYILENFLFSFLFINI
jgi:hypothetical protein